MRLALEEPPTEIAPGVSIAIATVATLVVLGRQIAARVDASERATVERFLARARANDDALFTRHPAWSWRLEELARVLDAFEDGIALR